MAAGYFASKQITTKRPPMTASGAHDLVCAQATFDLTEALEASDVIEMLVLPAGHKLVDAVLDTADVDTGGSPAVTLHVGTMAGTPYDATFASRDVTANIISASTVGQTGGVARASVTGFTKIAAQDTDRSIGVKCGTAPATGTTSGQIALTIWYRPMVHGE